MRSSQEYFNSFPTKLLGVIMFTYLKWYKSLNTQNAVKIFILLVFITGITSAQVPDKFENLKILPKDISKKELISTMKSFTNALGVRCYYCHVAEEEKDFKTYDFASDDKTHKQKARIMMRMVGSINKELQSKLTQYSDYIMKVNCLTCHHGQNEPKLLQDVLFRVIEKKGIEAGITRYKKLKEKYYGGFTYDFQVGTLSKLTEKLIKTKNFDAALTVSKLNVEIYPNSLFSLYYLGEANEAKGNKKEAIEAYSNALKYAPNNPKLKKKIESLKNKK